MGATSATTAITLAKMYTSLQFIVQVSEPLGQDLGSTEAPLFNDGALRGSQSPYCKAISDGIPSQLNSRITIEATHHFSAKVLEGAVVYILHLPLPSPTISSRILQAQIVAELKAHLVTLRENVRSRLFITVPLISESGNADVEAVSMACLRDLSLRQLSNDHAIDMTEFTNLLDTVRDSSGRLVLVDKLQARNNVTVAFELNYQGFASPQ